MRWTAAERRKARERMLSLHAAGAFGHLTRADRDLIARDIRTGRRQIDISLDWLITEARVSQIAKEYGCSRRRSGKKGGQHGIKGEGEVCEETSQDA